MARTELSVQTIIQAGLTPAFVAANTDGHSFINNGNTFLELVNAHTSATMTATVEHPGKIDGLDVADLVIAVPPSGTKRIGPFSARFNQAGTSYVNVSVSTSAGSAGAFRIG
jgi:hypothetical protein